jgi:DHA1 family bicyclomycin/chloramphenicol resistance-like MFS transporter
VTPDPSAPLTGGRLILLASLASLGALATNIMLPAFPVMARNIGVSSPELAWTLSSFFIVFAVGQLFVGPLADAYGRRPFVLGGLALFVIGSFICAFAPSLPVLIGGRVIQALGACAASVLARAIARDIYHGPQLTRALSLVMIAMAAAPGFSPALGAGLSTWFGWHSTFVFVAIAGTLAALHYLASAGETLAPDNRRQSRIGKVISDYAALAMDARFNRPALAVSLVIGCLYSFFGAAPAILMNGMGLDPTQLSIFFAATVLVVFASGLLGAPLARRWGAARAGMAGIALAVSGALWLVVQGDEPSRVQFMSAVTVFLAGMGLINPIGTAMALEPFGDRAGIASALLGFLQMACAAIGTALIGLTPGATATAFSWVMLGGMACAAAIFYPVWRNARLHAPA